MLALSSDVHFHFGFVQVLCRASRGLRVNQPRPRARVVWSDTHVSLGRGAGPRCRLPWGFALGTESEAYAHGRGFQSLAAPSRRQDRPLDRGLSCSRSPRARRETAG